MRFHSVIVTSFIWIFISQTVFGQTVDTGAFPRGYQQSAMRSVVKIHDLSDRFAGSGFVIGRDADGDLLIFTDRHVVADREHRYAIDFFPHGSIDQRINVWIMAQDAERDLAILAVRSDRDVPSLLLARESELPTTDCPILAVGFPNGRLTCHVSVTPGRRRFSSWRHGVDGSFWRIQHRSAGGISGAPVIVRTDVGFRVAGLWWGHSGEEGRASAEIQPFLRENGYGYLLSEDEQEEISVVQVLLQELEAISRELAAHP